MTSQAMDHPVAATATDTSPRAPTRWRSGTDLSPTVMAASLDIGAGRGWPTGGESPVRPWPAPTDRYAARSGERAAYRVVLVP
ncbi:hypothetical protein GCM10027080_01740 [Pedococcus soli]